MVLGERACLVVVVVKTQSLIKGRRSSLHVKINNNKREKRVREKERGKGLEWF